MFKGSENVGPGEHFYTIFSNGGTMNGTTNKERTLYFETMPANQLDAALFLEADRMRSLAIVKENLDNQRNAVQEERRLRRRQSAVRTRRRSDRRARLRQLRLQAFGDRIDGRLERRVGRGRRRVLQDLLRAQQRHHRHRRRREHRVDAASVRASTSSRFRRSRRRRRSTSASRRRSRSGGWTIEDPLARLPRARHRLSHPVEPVARRRRDRCARPDPGRRPQLPPLRAHRARKSSSPCRRRRSLPTAAAPGCSASKSRPHAGQVARRSSSRRSTRRSTASRPGRLPIRRWRRRGTRRGASSSGASATSLALARQPGGVRAVVRQPRPDQSRDGIGWPSSAPADVQRVAKQYLTPENRTVVVTHPKPAASAGNGGAR